MKMNSTLLTLQQMLNNQNINLDDYVGNLCASIPIFQGMGPSSMISQTVWIILQEYLLRVPYIQNLNILQIRMQGIIAKYSINLFNYQVKFQQLQNFYSMLNQNTARSVKYTTNLTSDINTNNTTNEANANAFNPVDNANVNISLSEATNNNPVIADGINTASVANSNFKTEQNQKQDTTHTATEEDITVYNNITYALDNLLQPILTAFNSLFYIFDFSEGDFLW